MKKPAKEKADIVVVAGEHIFPATALVPLCLRWKSLTSSGQHAEAMILLEEIIIKSTPMFERLAQHEAYDHTVGLPVLVAAAQEKVVRWILKWDPKRSIFSYFSKSLSGDNRVLLADGSLKRIDEIVNNRLPVSVVTWDEERKEFTTKPVTDWIVGPAERKSWRTVVVESDTDTGTISSVTATHDHEFYTQRGWVKVDDLAGGDMLHACTNGKLSSCSRWVVSTEIDGTRSDTTQKYDITVADTKNFVAEGVVVHNCAKNAFLSELVKVNTFRNRFYVTSDNLEQFYGQDDHTVDKHDLADEFDKSLQNLYCRWGDPQEKGAIKYLTECLVHDLDNHDKLAAVRGASYAWGISIDMSKFFYSWVLCGLRELYYKKIRVPFTEEDIVRHAYSYTNFVDLYEILDHDKIKWLIATRGGQRIRIPTIAQLMALKRAYQVAKAVGDSDKDPDSVAEVAKEHKTTPRTAQESYCNMIEVLKPNRTGEHQVFGED